MSAQTWQAATDAVLDAHGLTLEHVRSAGRVERLVAARRDLIFTLRSEPFLWSAPRIARFLHRDHTTILFHMRAMGMEKGVQGRRGPPMISKEQGAAR